MAERHNLGFPPSRICRNRKKPEARPWIPASSAGMTGSGRSLTPYALRLTPYALRLTPYALRLTPYALRLTPTKNPASLRKRGSLCRKEVILLLLSSPLSSVRPSWLSWPASSRLQASARRQLLLSSLSSVLLLSLLPLLPSWRLRSW